MPLTHWKHSLRQSFRLLPDPSDHLVVFLSSDGRRKEDVLASLPYAAARSSAGDGATIDPKRYRDPRYVYESIGLLYEDASGTVRLTELGKALARAISWLTEGNAPILGRHVAYALNTIQLRNPTRPGQEYADEVEVLPARFIWEAMLKLDNKISSDELNRGILRATNREQLIEIIDRIAAARASGDLDCIGEELVTGGAKNDRIIPWVSIASCGWLLIAPKDGRDQYYNLRPWAVSVVRQALSIPCKHRDYASTEDYIGCISDSACLPPDLRR